MDDEEFSDVDVFGAIPTEFVAEEGEVESVAPLLQNSNEDSQLEGLDYGLEDSFAGDADDFDDVATFIQKLQVNHANTNISTFCTEDNIWSCCKYLNSTLEALDLLDTPLSFHGENGEARLQDYVAALNTVYRVLQHLQSHKTTNLLPGSNLEEQDERVRRLDLDLQQASSRLKDAQDDLSKTQRKEAQLKQQCRELEKSMEHKQQQWEKEKQRLLSQIQGFKQREQHFQHELRKMEMEGNQLKKRLRTVVIDKRADIRQSKQKLPPTRTDQKVGIASAKVRPEDTLLDLTGM